MCHVTKSSHKKQRDCVFDRYILFENPKVDADGKLADPLETETPNTPIISGRNQPVESTLIGRVNAQEICAGRQIHPISSPTSGEVRL